MHVRVYLSRYRSTVTCPDCHGTRFKPQPRLYRVDGHHRGSLRLSVGRAAAFFNTLPMSSGDYGVALILDEIRSRLRYLHDVGLDYLTLDRQSRTLSGEVQRVALASALGASLVNTLYVLDEPSIGLHPSDNQRLIRILERLGIIRTRSLWLSTIRISSVAAISCSISGPVPAKTAAR